MGLYKRGKKWGISYFRDGKHIREMIGTKKEAEKEWTAIQAQIHRRAYQPPREDSFADLSDAYEAEQENRKGYRTEKNYIDRVRAYFEETCPIVQDITVEDVEVFRDWLTALPKRGKNGGKRSGIDINHHLRVLHTILKRAVNRDWIAKNPVDPERVKRPSRGRGRTQYLAVDEVGRLLDACTPHLYSLVLCHVETGMRVEEVNGLRWSEIRSVMLNDGLTVRMIFLPAERTKTGQARKVPVTPLLAAHLDALRDAQRNEKVPVLEDLVFRSPTRRTDARHRGGMRHLVGGTWRGEWRAAIRQAGLPEDIQRRDLRRTFRTHLKMRGADSFLLNEILGHGNPAIEKIYTQVENEALVRTMGLIPDWNSHKTSTHLSDKKMRTRSEIPQTTKSTGHPR